MAQLKTGNPIPIDPHHGARWNGIVGIVILQLILLEVAGVRPAAKLSIAIYDSSNNVGCVLG